MTLFKLPLAEEGLRNKFNGFKYLFFLSICCFFFSSNFENPEMVGLVCSEWCVDLRCLSFCNESR